MGQNIGSLTNVKSYKATFIKSNTSKRATGIQSLLKGKKSDKNILQMLDKILSYEGYGDMEVPGSVIGYLPKITNLPVNRLADLLEMSTSSYYRKMKVGILEMDSVDKMSSLLKIYYKGLNAFEGVREDFEDWLNMQIPNLGNMKPLELLKTENGRIAVLNAIDRVEYNIYG